MFKERQNGFALLLLLFACFPAARILCAQTSKPFNLRVDVELVPVEVVVLDKNGNPVKNLKKENFRIYEDGKRQEISSFDEISESRSFNSLLGIDDGGPTNAKTVLILFDDSTLSSESINKARSSAAQFVKDHMKPPDFFAVASFANDLKVLQNFTNDPDKILRAISQAASFIANPSPSSPEYHIQKMSEPRHVQTENLLRALQQINHSVERVKGKKAVLIYSESNYLDITPIEKTYTGALNSAKRSNVVYYTVDPGGLKSAAIDASPPQWSPTTTTTPIRPPEIDHKQSGGSAMSLLKALASETGGTSIFNVNNYSSALADLDRQLSNYYLIGFSSNNPKRDGNLRNLRVETDIKGVVLKHRKSYPDRRPLDMLAKSRQEEKLLEALASPKPATLLPVVFRPACFFESSLVRVLIFAEIGLEKAIFKRNGDLLETELSIMGMAYAEDGSIAARFSETLRPKFEKSTAQDIRSMSLPYRNYFKLRPGKYRLKLAVSDKSNNIGSTEQDYEAPGKPEKELAVSSLVIVSQKSALPDLVQDIQARMLDESDPLVHNGMQFAPSVRHKFATGAVVPLLFRIYNIDGRPNQGKLQVKVRLISDKGEEFAQPPIHLSESLLAATGNSEAAATLDLAFPAAKPGKYTLSIETIESGSVKSVIAKTDLELTAN